MEENKLKHSGVLGQKWGHRNGPPYPLNPAKDYSAAERKANPSVVKKAKAKLESAINKKKKEHAEIKAAKIKAKKKMKDDIEEAKQKERINKVKEKYAAKAEKKSAELSEQKKIVNDILRDPTPEKIVNNRALLTTQQIRSAREKMEELDRIQSRISPTKEAKVKRFIGKTIENVAWNTATKMAPTAVEAAVIYALGKSDQPIAKAINSALKDQRKSKNKNNNQEKKD